MAHLKDSSPKVYANLLCFSWSLREATLSWGFKLLCSIFVVAILVYDCRGSHRG
jgi:hypothetical protein